MGAFACWKKSCWKLLGLAQWALGPEMLLPRTPWRPYLRCKLHVVASADKDQDAPDPAPCGLRAPRDGTG